MNGYGDFQNVYKGKLCNTDTKIENFGFSKA